MKTIKPAAKQIFAKPDEIEEVTKSGFYINKNTMERPKTATVINIGSEVKGYKANDTIVYKAYAPTDVKVNNEDYIIVDQEDVLGILVDVQEV